MLAQGPLRDSEVTQRIKEATGEAEAMFPTPRHPVMWPDMGFVELPVGLVFWDSIARATRACGYEGGEPCRG